MLSKLSTLKTSATSFHKSDTNEQIIMQKNLLKPEFVFVKNEKKTLKKALLHKKIDNFGKSLSNKNIKDLKDNKDINGLSIKKDLEVRSILKDKNRKKSNSPERLIKFKDEEKSGKLAEIINVISIKEHYNESNNNDSTKQSNKDFNKKSYAKCSCYIY